MNRMIVGLFILAGFCSAQTASVVSNRCVGNDYYRGRLYTLACVQCISTATPGELVCNRCKNTPTKKDGSCGNPATEPIPITNCIYYYEESKRCTGCQSGYYLYLNKCFKGSLKKCDVSDYYGGRERCFSCLEGYTPVSNFYGCEKNHPDKQQVDLEIQGRGCLIYSLDVPNESNTANFSPSNTPPKLKCSLCKDNFILKKYKEYNREYSKCEAPTSTVQTDNFGRPLCGKGCASCDSDGRCLWCNHMENYFMVDRYTCVKHSFKIIIGLLSLILLPIFL